jgi:hypothetical protein
LSKFQSPQMARKGQLTQRGKPNTEGASPVKTTLQPATFSKRFNEIEDERTLQILEKLKMADRNEKADSDSIGKQQKSYLIRSPSKKKLGSNIQSTSNMSGGNIPIPGLSLNEINPVNRRGIEKSSRSSKFVSKFTILK